MNTCCLSRAVSFLALVPMVLVAQVARGHDPIPLKHWPAPLYWQPTPAQPQRADAPLAASSNLPIGNNALVFVAMTPCRVVDTRAGFGFSGSFGPPSLAAGLPVRTIPIQASSACPVPSVAQAYSFNVTVVPPGPLIYLTLYPATADPQPPPPNVSTLNSFQGYVVANAAIVPAGTDGQGSVDVFASDPTDLIIDINGYYAAPGDMQSNVALGTGALANNTTGSQNSAEGANALQFNTTGSNNTASGASALSANTGGNDNTAAGSGALLDNTTGSGNTAAGSHALQFNTTGNHNTAAGHAALQNNTTANMNTAIGDSALGSNTTGTLNTASGAAALSNNTTGSSNTAAGTGALSANTTGTGNTAMGQASLFAVSTGVNNTATGVNALFNNISNGNTATGANAMQANTTGFQNTAVGLNTLASNTTGNGNTGIGQGALNSNTTGSENIGIGQGAAHNVSGGNSNNIHIGSGGQAGDSATIRIGGTTALGETVIQTRFFAAGIRGVATGSNDAVPVVIDSNGQLGTVSSSLRFKEDIHDMGDASSGLLRLRPVTFRYRQPFADGSKPIEYGLIAEEVAEIYPDLVARSADGQIESVKYQVLDPMLLNEVQKQAEQIRSLESRLAALEASLSKAPAPAADR